MKKIIVFILVFFFAMVFAAGDSIIFDSNTKTLSYIIDYDRLVVNAKTQRCSPEAFKAGLLHSVLNNIFLFLPYEASFRDDVEILEVRVLKTTQNGNEELVLRAASTLTALKATNETFRVFMNGFVSTNSSYCFAVSPETMKSWLNTLFARGGELVYDDEIFDIKLPTQVSPEQNTQIINNRPTTNTDDKSPEANQEIIDKPNTVADSTTKKELITVLGKEYYIVPFLSDAPIREFDRALDRLEPNQNYLALVETSKGTMLVDLFESKTPKTVNNFIFLALNHFYDNLDFFNVSAGFIAQTGDPSGTGSGGAGYIFDDEIYTAFNHSAPGILSMVNSGPNTNSSQFLFTLAPAPNLDRQNTIFGAVIGGIEVLALLEKIDLSQPLAIASLDSSLGLLEIQGISLDGNENQSLEDYLKSILGSLPKEGIRANIANYSFVTSTNPQTNKLAINFYIKPDTIKAITIIQKR